MQQNNNNPTASSTSTGISLTPSSRKLAYFDANTDQTQESAYYPKSQVLNPQEKPIIERLKHKFTTRDGIVGDYDYKALW